MVKGRPTPALSAAVLVASLSLCREGRVAVKKMAVKNAEPRSGGSDLQRLGRVPTRSANQPKAFRLHVSPNQAAMFPSQMVHRVKVHPAPRQTVSSSAQVSSPKVPSSLQQQPGKPVHALTTRPKSTPSRRTSLLTKRAKLLQDRRNLPDQRRPFGARVEGWQSVAPLARRRGDDDNNNVDDDDERECLAGTGRKGYPIAALSSTTLTSVSSSSVKRRATPRSLLSGELGDTERSMTSPSAFSSLCSLAPPVPPGRADGRFLSEASNNAAQVWSAAQGLASDNDETASDKESDADGGSADVGRDFVDILLTKAVGSLTKLANPEDRGGKILFSPTPRLTDEDRKRSTRHVKAMRERHCSRNMAMQLDHVFDVSSRRGHVLKPENPDEQLSNVAPTPPAAKQLQQSSSSESEDYDTDLEISLSRLLL